MRAGVLVLGLMFVLALAAGACRAGEQDREADQVTVTASPLRSAEAQASPAPQPSATAQVQASLTAQPSATAQAQPSATAQPSPMVLAQASPTAQPSSSAQPPPTEQPPATVAATVGAGYPPGTSVQEIVSGGQTRQFRVHAPPSYQPGTPMPLVLNLHGLNETAAQQEALSGMSAKADSVGFIVVYPEGIDQTWHIGPGPAGAVDMQFIRDLVSELQSRLTIDLARIYATGISNGAQMSNLLGCNTADIFAAIGPVSGGYSPAQECAPGRAVPVVGFHGTADQLIPYEGDAATGGRLLMPAKEWAAAWAARNGCSPTPSVTYQGAEVTGETWSGCQEGADVVFYTIEGGGHGWPGAGGVTTTEISATDIIWNFFVAHPMP